MAKYRIDMKDGSVAIMQVVDGHTVAECLAKWIDPDKSNVLGYDPIAIDESKLPPDRIFRKAWVKHTDGTIIEHLEKSKEIKKEQFRQYRKPLLEALDLEFMKALENGLDTQPITAKKQELRDVTKISLPNNIEELKGFIPEILKATK